MDLWDFLERNTTKSRLQYKKWLEVSSSHFSFKTEDDKQIKTIRRIVRSAKEYFEESGNYLIYLSSNYYYNSNTETNIPLFLTPVTLEWIPKDQVLFWKVLGQTYFLNHEKYIEHIELPYHEIESWIENNFLDNSLSIFKGQSALFFDLNHKSYIEKDLKQILAKKLSSSSLLELFNENIIRPRVHSRPDFLSLVHSLPMDDSQAEGVSLASFHSCHIVGPPGTGKSQTIVNIAVQDMLKGRRVAILSQKKAALEVLNQRFENIGLQDYILNLNNDIILVHFYKSLENLLDRFLLGNIERLDKVNNLSYFKHCIRTLEDFFQARLDFISLSKFKNIDVKLIHPLHPIFEIYFPYRGLLEYRPKDLIQELIYIQNLLARYPILSKYKLEIIACLGGALNLVSQLDYKELRKILKHGAISKKVKELEKQKLKLLASKPAESELAVLGEDKLVYYLNYLMSNDLIIRFFDSKAKEISKDILDIHSEWKDIKLWTKIERVKNALNHLKWDKQWSDIQFEEKKLSHSKMAGLQIESFMYILDKLNSKLPSWEIMKEVLFYDNELHLDYWQELIRVSTLLISRNDDLRNWNVAKFLTADLQQDFDIDNITWEKLCSLNFDSMKSWHQYSKNNSVGFSSVLKNYTLREIVQMSQYVRKNYQNFTKEQLEYEINTWSFNKLNFLGEFLKSKKAGLKSQRLSWKESIQFINKKWSQKRKYPNLYKALSRIDIELLLWLKPITISSFDKFSKYLPLSMELYDTLIIDEASQVELIDSIPALVRAKKVIIVGDGKQLTPGRFFKYHNFQLEQSHESLLELAEEKLPIVSLRNQYRAKFQELIAFSNYFFYNNQLSLTHKSNPESFRRIFVSEGVYHNRTNAKEAERLVKELISYIENNEKCKSIGVITFSVQQKEAILQKLEEEMECNAILKKGISELDPSTEPFFIKSIEQVQGDERDAIFISTGYAKNEHGKLYKFFGPILTHKGENRLNVLMSRAREKIFFITSLKESDIQLGMQASQGLKIFRQLLHFAEQPKSSFRMRSNKSSNYWQYFLNPFKT